MLHTFMSLGSTTRRRYLLALQLRKMDATKCANLFSLGFTLYFEDPRNVSGLDRDYLGIMKVSFRDRMLHLPWLVYSATKFPMSV